jgi:hypothetical protein
MNRVLRVLLNRVSPVPMSPRPLAEMADLLGFSGLSASRWSSAPFHCCASAWRAAYRGRIGPTR